MDINHRSRHQRDIAKFKGDLICESPWRQKTAVRKVIIINQILLTLIIDHKTPASICGGVHHHACGASSWELQAEWEYSKRQQS